VNEPLQLIGLSLLMEKLKESMANIYRRLGGLRAQEVLSDLDQMAEAVHSPESFRERGLVWIVKLITWYYDPMYFDSLQRRNPKVLFKGSRADVQLFLQDFDRLKKKNLLEKACQ
jgi:tRNA 2-selenouridine synthase